MYPFTSLNKFSIYSWATFSTRPQIWIKSESNIQIFNPEFFSLDIGSGGVKLLAPQVL